MQMKSKWMVWAAAFAALLLVLPATVLGQTARGGRKHRPTVALVLGGGGAKGAAQVGALKEIVRSGVPIDYVVGTSIGSIVGGLYSLGYSPEHLDSLFCAQDWVQLFSDAGAKGRRKMPQVKGFGLLGGHGVMQFLDDLVAQSPANVGTDAYVSDSVDFNLLPIPYRAVAGDVRSGSAIALSRGRISLAMRASMAIPGVFKTVQIDSLVLLDGGIVNNLPVDVARELGADYVIAVDLTQNKHPDYKPSTLGLLMPRTVRWLLERPDIVNYNRNRENCDIYINPDLEGYGATSFKPAAIRAMIDQGQQTAKKAHKKLVALRRKVLGR